MEDRCAKIRALEGDVERCERILAQTGVVQRLPDRGARLETRLGQLRKELDLLRCEQSMETASVADAQPTNPSKSSASAAAEEASPPAQSSSTDDKAARERQKAEDDRKFQLEIGEKYKHFRVDAREELKRAFGTQLCSQEVERLCCAVEPNYLLSHEESVKVEREVAAFLRREELQAMKRKNNPTR